MSEPMHLLPAEIVEATGAHRRARQLEFFLERGIPAELGRDGKVKVLRAAYYAKMMPSTAPRARTKTEPRLDLLKKAG